MKRLIPLLGLLLLFVLAACGGAAPAAPVADAPVDSSGRCGDEVARGGWRKRVGVEPTPDDVGRPTRGFEDRGGHRAPCASGDSSRRSAGHRN